MIPPVPSPSRDQAPSNLRVPLLFLILLAALPASVVAQDNSGWVGKRVILPFDTVLRVGNQVVDNQKLQNRSRGGQRNSARIYKVKQVNGLWLGLVAESGGARGWVQSTEVIDYDRAIDHFTNAIRANPADGSAYNSRGHIWSDKKEYDIAIADYNAAIRIDPGSEAYWVNRGAAWSKKKEYDKAIADYNEAIRLDPSYATAYINRGSTWDVKKDYDKAIADDTEAIRLDPSGATAYINRGVVWRNKKDYDKAIADYTEAIRLDPKSSYPFYLRSGLRMILHRDDAVDGFKSVLELQGWKGDRALYAALLGHFAAKQTGKETEAKAFVDDAAAKCDPSAWPYPVVKYLKGDLDEAGLLSLAVDDKKRAEVRCFLGLDLALKGRKDEAIAHYRWVKEHGNATNIEFQIACAELDRMEKLAPSPITTETKTPEPGKPAEIAKAAALDGTTLYVPIPDLETRFGTDPEPMASYIKALAARANSILAESDPTTARGLLVAVGLKTGKRSKVWCQAVEGEIPAALLKTLERELAEVEAIELKKGPAGFALKLRLAGRLPTQFPEFPDRWKDAAESTRSKTLIPPDDLFRILWPD